MYHCPNWYQSYQLLCSLSIYFFNELAKLQKIVERSITGFISGQFGTVLFSKFMSELKNNPEVLRDIITKEIPFEQLDSLTNKIADMDHKNS